MPSMLHSFFGHLRYRHTEIFQLWSASLQFNMHQMLKKLLDVARAHQYGCALVRLILLHITR